MTKETQGKQGKPYRKAKLVIPVSMGSMDPWAPKGRPDLKATRVTPVIDDQKVVKGRKARMVLEASKVIRDYKALKDSKVTKATKVRQAWLELRKLVQRVRRVVLD